MGSKVDESFCVYGAGILTRHIASLHQEMEGVRQAQDIEYVHRMRVATRRLRNALPLFETCYPAKKSANWTRQIKKITRVLGKVRDTDVQIEFLKDFDTQLQEPRCHPGIRRLIMRLTQQRDRLQEPVLAALTALEENKALDEMAAYFQPLAERQDQIYLYTPYLYQQGFNAIASKLEDFLSYETYIYDPERVEELHAMRISAKHLRYTLETFASLYPDELKEYLQVLRNIQDHLGEIHDCDVWMVSLPKFIDRETKKTLAYFNTVRPMRRLTPGLIYFMENQQAQRRTLYDTFIDYWKQQKDAHIWNNLFQALQIPFYLGGPVQKGQLEPNEGSPSKEDIEDENRTNQ